MGKIQAIQQLDDLGLNVPELLLEIKQFDSAKAVKWESFYLKEGSRSRTSEETKTGVPRYSIRTERDGEVLCPHHPNLTLKQSNTKVRDLCRQGYAVYIFRGIDPKDCIAKGNVFWGKQGETFKLTVEYTLGRGTVRDNEVAIVKSFTAEEDRLQQETAGINSSAARIALTALVEECVEYKDDFKDSIVEWSYYNSNIGKHKESLIFWEIRPWK